MKTHVIIRVCGLLALASMVGACEKPPPVETTVAPPELELEGVGFRFFRGNELRATGRADRATIRRDSGDVTADRVRLRFDEAYGGAEVQLDAAAAVGNIRGQHADATGGVHLRGADETRGWTERAHIDAAGGVVRGNDPVVFQQGQRVDAYAMHGFVLDFARTGNLQFEGPVRTRLRGTR